MFKALKKGLPTRSQQQSYRNPDAVDSRKTEHYVNHRYRQGSDDHEQGTLSVFVVNGSEKRGEQNASEWYKGWEYS